MSLGLYINQKQRRILILDLPATANKSLFHFSELTQNATNMPTLLTKLFNNRKAKKPIYGWSIFAMDDKIQLTRRVTEAQRKQALQLH